MPYSPFSAASIWKVSFHHVTFRMQRIIFVKIVNHVALEKAVHRLLWSWSFTSAKIKSKIEYWAALNVSVHKKCAH